MSEEVKNDVSENPSVGYLAHSLNRTNKQIRQERGDAIAEDLEIIYRRKVEDLETDVKRSITKQKNAFDFSPTNSQSLVMAKELESVDILERDLELGVKVRELKIKLNIAKERYNILFGEKYNLEPII